MELEEEDEILVDPREAVAAFYENAKSEQGRLRLLPTTRLKTELPYNAIWDKLIDPYYGPDPDEQ
jgi:hypothetical protein